MKKFFAALISMLLIFAISSGCIASAAEEAAAGDVTLTSTLDSSFTKNQIAKVKCEITNTTGKYLGASIKLFLDGKLIEGAGSDYFVLYERNSEAFEFVVPTDLDPDYSHALLLVLNTDDGRELYSSSVFTVSNDFVKLDMMFCSTPEAINPGVDLYYGIKFSAPAGKAYNVRLVCMTSGIYIPEVNYDITVVDGTVHYVCIPAGYNQGDPAQFDAIFTVNPDWNYGIMQSSLSAAKEARFKALKSVITSVQIPAYIKVNTNGYSYASLSGYLTTIPAGTTVEYMNPDDHESMRSARVKTPSGIVCWVPMSNIYISTANYTVKDTLSNDDKEIFVNGMGYSSKTPYLVWVDKQRQRLNLFIGSQGNWKILNSFPVATGRNTTPTPTTVCEYKYPTYWVTEDYTCNPVLYLYDGYAIHNQPRSHSGYVLDSTIGNPASAGCVRMLLNDAYTLYYTVPVKTTVVLY